MQATCRTQNSKQFCVKPAEPQLTDNALQSMYSQQTVSVQSAYSHVYSQNGVRLCFHMLQMACVVEHLPASQRQASLRSQNQPGFPPRVIEPPCTAWLLLEKELSIPQQVSSSLPPLTLH